MIFSRTVLFFIIAAFLCAVALKGQWLRKGRL